MKHRAIIDLALLAALTLALSLALAGCNKEPVPEPEPVYELADSVGTGLPVIYIRTKFNAAITSKENWTSAQIEIFGGEKFDILEMADCTIKGRGNSTWVWPKKPYVLKLESKTSLFGLPKHKRWVLMANFMDRTMMRNIVAMKVGALTSLDWTPRFESVELVLNGVHRGNYLLIEQVRADSNRVPVDEKKGYLLELDFHDDNEVQWISPYGQSFNAACQRRSGIPFAVKNPDPSDITESQVNWVKNHIDSVASVLYGPTISEAGNGLDQCIDYQSFADYFIVYELMINGELYNPGSIYFHFNPGEKIKAGPLWDFDWGTLSYNCHSAARSSLINSGGVWYVQLLQNPEFVAVLKQRWIALKPSLETVPAYIDSTKSQLTASASKNFLLWNPAEDSNFNNGNIINGDENLTFASAVNRLKTIYSERLTTLNTIIPNL